MASSFLLTAKKQTAPILLQHVPEQVNRPLPGIGGGFGIAGGASIVEKGTLGVPLYKTQDKFLKLQLS